LTDTEPPTHTPLMERMDCQAKPLHLMLRLIQRVGLLSAPVLVLVGLSGCIRGVLDPVGPIGASERVILLDATAIMLAVIIET
jgi:hypothetical protein